MALTKCALLLLFLVKSSWSIQDIDTETDLASIVFDGQHYEQSCIGSLRVHMSHPERGVVTRTIRGSRRSNLGRRPGFSALNVFRVEVQGNCCWELFPNAFMRGSPMFLPAGYDANPGPFRSLRKRECSVQAIIV